MGYPPPESLPVVNTIRFQSLPEVTYQVPEFEKCIQLLIDSYKGIAETPSSIEPTIAAHTFRSCFNKLDCDVDGFVDIIEGINSSLNASSDKNKQFKDLILPTLVDCLTTCPAWLNQIVSLQVVGQGTPAELWDIFAKQVDCFVEICNSDEWKAILSRNVHLVQNTELLNFVTFAIFLIRSGFVEIVLRSICRMVFTLCNGYEAEFNKLGYKFPKEYKQGNYKLTNLGNSKLINTTKKLDDAFADHVRRQVKPGHGAVVSTIFIDIIKEICQQFNDSRLMVILFSNTQPSPFNYCLSLCTEPESLTFSNMAVGKITKGCISKKDYLIAAVTNTINKPHENFQDNENSEMVE